METLKTIKTKHAVRQFSDEPVPEDVIRLIVDSGRRSQSSKNSQPWYFIVIQDRARLEALSKTGTYAGHVAGAAFAVVLVGTQHSDWNSFDLGQASSYLQLAAWDLGVGSCIATLHNEAAAREVLGLPDDTGLFLAISFGYPAKDWTPNKGGRRPLDEVIKWETW